MKTLDHVPILAGLLFTMSAFSADAGNSASNPSSATARWWSDAADAALRQAGTNRPELLKALEQTPSAQHEGMSFLIENMPADDLQTLSANFLLENTRLSYDGLAEAPWSGNISKEIFFNDILPYASMTEQRDNWRHKLHEVCAPLVKDCKTPSEAAQNLNEKIYKLLKVRYSTNRRATDQGPFETMRSGVATCTGLSILLVDACRSVGVPARLAGTPLWFDNSGNHTWVEIWDGGWHFTGAAEPDPKGLDRGWFVHNASKATIGDPAHGIFATSFKKTGTSFPMVWAKNVTDVYAENVTERYAQPATPTDTGNTRLLVRVLDRPVGKRVEAKIMVTDPANAAFRVDGTSKDESADLNDHLALQLSKQHTYIIAAEQDGVQRHQYFTTGTNKEDNLTMYMDGVPLTSPIAPPAFCAAPKEIKPLAAKDEAKLKTALAAYFTASADQQAKWKFPRVLEKLLRDNEPAVRRAAWETFREAPIHAAMKNDFGSNRVRFESHVSPYVVRAVGTRPPNGWALFIAMHGGGGVPQDVNDSQWEQMKQYYRDHPEAGGYLYLALRAPDNTWNGFYTGYAYPLIANLTQQFLLFGDVDPNKVFLMGYSHGGYGAFSIGPKMPDHFAAIHASAAALGDGAVAATLRNTPFTCMVGENDTAYGRIKLDREFAEKIKELRGDRHDIYPVAVTVIANHPHSGLPDRDKITEMYPFKRHVVPEELTWPMTDNVIHDFFWLHADKPTAGQELDAICRDNKIQVTATNCKSEAAVFLDSRLIDFSKPVKLEFNGKSTTYHLKPELRTFCETLQRRGDPELAFSAEIKLPIQPAAKL